MDKGLEAWTSMENWGVLVVLCDLWASMMCRGALHEQSGP